MARWTDARTSPQKMRLRATDLQHLGNCFESRTRPTDTSLIRGVVGEGFSNKSCCCFPAQPNEKRLSCGAELEYSQMQFYYEGRRQLQPPVRLRTDGVAEVPQLAPALEGHSPHLAPAPPG